MGLPSNWDSLLYTAVSSCCRYMHTDTHTLPNLNKHTHQQSKYRPPLKESAYSCCLGGGGGLQLRVLCANTSPLLHQQHVCASCDGFNHRRCRKLQKTFQLRNEASLIAPPRMEDPPPAHPLGLPWQRVTWLCLVTGATGPDASGGFKVEGGSSRARVSRRRHYLRFSGRR